MTRSLHCFSALVLVMLFDPTMVIHCALPERRNMYTFACIWPLVLRQLLSQNTANEPREGFLPSARCSLRSAS